MADYSRLLDAAIRAVGEACSLCRTVQANMGALRAITKEDKSPVTVADFGSQAVVARRLQEALGRPVHLVGEETSAYLRNPEHAPQLDATLAAVRTVWPDADEDDLLAAIDLGAGDPHHAEFWTLDPIDGTKGFLRGGQYAVSLAFIERGHVTIGLLGSPNLAASFDAPLDRPDSHGCIHFALRNQGAYEVPADTPLAHPVRIVRPRHTPGSPARFAISIEESHTDQSIAARLIARFGAVDPARLDSQAKYAVIARGQADVYFRIPTRPGYTEWIWDHAAGAIIAAECGCAVTDADGRELDFSRGRKLSQNRGIIAAPPELHGQVLGALREVQPNP
jgi:HAL2 family 3'(2'),5'-bisphosphate nucleotidase